MTNHLTRIPVDQLHEGTRVLYPHQTSTGSIEDRPVTIGRIVEYPRTRLLYFTDGGMGVADRIIDLPQA